jgi:hypothetical protein
VFSAATITPMMLSPAITPEAMVRVFLSAHSALAFSAA